MLATPVMINVIEAAALAAVEHLLPAGHQSLGIHLDVSHTAATPIGLRVTATAEVERLEGRTVTFRVEARDEFEPIGGGTHRRVVVSDGGDESGVGMQVVDMRGAFRVARHECRQRAGGHRVIHDSGDGANNGQKVSEHFHRAFSFISLKSAHWHAGAGLA